MKIGVAGLWHLGCVTAGCLASAGYSVIGWDDDSALIERLKQGKPPVAEPGLQPLLQQNLASGRISFTTVPTELCACDILWVTFDTPVDANDQADVEFVVSRVANLMAHLKPGVLILVSSQLPVGSTRRLETLWQTTRPGIPASFACMPENLRLGKAIEVFTRPDRVVAGVSSAADRERIAALLKPFTETIEWMSVESAEMTKHALNAFLATSVVFINEIAAICEHSGADAREVERGLKSDVRIGRRAYLRAGGAFAGGTLARDIVFLQEIGSKQNLPNALFAAVNQSNDAHKQWQRRRLQELFPQLRGARICILGLTYKPGTNTLRRSSAVELAQWLAEQGAVISAHDPAVDSLPDELSRIIRLEKTAEAAASKTAALVVGTECPEFTTLNAADLCGWMSAPVVLDAGRLLETQWGQDSRIKYIAVGKGTYPLP